MDYGLQTYSFGQKYQWVRVCDVSGIRQCLFPFFVLLSCSSLGVRSKHHAGAKSPRTRIAVEIQRTRTRVDMR